MMLCAKDLRTIPVTVHIALAEVPSRLTPDLIVRQARIAARDLSLRFGIDKPRLGVTGLNPHAGEAGAMGSEEQTIIAPAIASLRRKGSMSSVPFPPIPLSMRKRAPASTSSCACTTTRR